MTPDTRTTENPPNTDPRPPVTSAAKTLLQGVKDLRWSNGNPVQRDWLAAMLEDIENDAMQSGYNRGVGAVRRYNPPPVVDEDVLTEALANVRHKDRSFDRQSKAVRGRLLAAEYARLMDQPR